MKVLSIGTDRKLFDEGSAVLERSLSYSSKMEELHIIVFTKRGFEKKTIGNLHIYPTNSISRLFYVFDAYSVGKNIIGNYRDIVISSQDPFETGLVAYFLKKKFSLPLQLQVHTDFLSPLFKNSFLNLVRVIIANFLIPKADGLRVVSEDISVSIKNKFNKIKSSIDILPIYVDFENISKEKVTNDLQKQFPQFKFIILMASRLTSEKRLDIALQSFKKVLENFKDAGLVIAGSGHEKGHLLAIVRQIGIEKNVVFVGWQESLVSYYKTADMFLLTSDYEGYGMTLIEAAACCCPIVTTRVGIAKSTLFKNDENALVCPVGDIECLTKSINDLASNNWKRELFKRNMQDSIRHKLISKEEYVNQYVALLEKLQK